MLKASMRNSKLKRSVSMKFFMTDMSAVKECGPYSEYTPALPSVPAQGLPQAPYIWRQFEPTAGLSGLLGLLIGAIGVKYTTLCVIGLKDPPPRLKLDELPLIG